MFPLRRHYTMTGSYGLSDMVFLGIMLITVYYYAGNWVKPETLIRLGTVYERGYRYGQ